MEKKEPEEIENNKDNKQKKDNKDNKKININMSKQIDRSLIMSKKTRTHKEHQVICKPIRPSNHIRL